jgi:hypothetical protein
MATNILRSMNADMKEGASDGKYRKARPDTTVAPLMGDELVREERASLHPFHGYGFPTTEYPSDQRVTHTR